MPKRIFMMGDVINFIWGAIVLLASGVAATYAKVCSKVDKKELRDYVSKEEYKAFKQDIKELFQQHEHSISARIEDKFDAILLALDAKQPQRKNK